MERNEVKAALRESEWIQALRAGDMSWFGELVEAYQHRVYAMSFRKTGCAADAEDLAQEIFLQIYRKLPQFRFEASLSTWLFRVALNCAASFNRKRLSRSELLGADAPEGISDGAPDDDMLQLEREQAVHKALGTLKRAPRETLELFYFQRLSTAEIACVLGISARGVETRLRRARGQMKKALAATGYFEEVDELGQLGEMASRLS